MMDIQNVPFVATMIAIATSRAVEGEPGYELEHACGERTWVPEALFLSSFRINGAMRFGDALEYLKGGHKVARGTGGGFLQVANGRIMIGNDDLVSDQAWQPSADDLLAEDWRMVP